MTAKEYKLIAKYISYDEVVQQFRDGKWEDVTPMVLVAEIEQLTEETALAKTESERRRSELVVMMERLLPLEQENARLTAENDRLRAALDEMKDLLDAYSQDGHDRPIAVAANIADEALKGGSQ